jgi:hypothetical protein
MKFTNIPLMEFSMRQPTFFLLSALALVACGEKDTDETTDTGVAEDTAVTEDTGTVEETDTEETDTEETDTEETDTEETDTQDTGTETDPLDVDDDGDGFTENEGDCDDTDAALNPADGDADGVSSCDGDCDDADATVFPGAPDDENDGLDQNCDGTPDDGYVPSNGAATVDMLIPGDLVITEVMQNPCVYDLNANSGNGGCTLDDSVGEWFEVYNNTNTEVDLDGLMVTDEPGSNQDAFTVSGTLLVPAGGYVVFGLSADGNVNGGITVNYEYTDMNLSNGSDELMLHNSTDILDSVAWDNGTTFPDPTGAAMNLDPGSLNSTDNDDGANWCDAITPITGVTVGTMESDLGTPGAPNDTCPPPVTTTSYATDVEPLLGSCMGCHGTQFFSSYSALMAANSGDHRPNNASANTMLVVPGNAAGSYLYQKMVGTASAGNQMSASAAAVSAVEQWINDGANP